MRGHDLSPLEIVVFHFALGLRPGLLQWADRLRAAGYRVHMPDLYDGEVFDDASGAIRKIQELGFDEILLRGQVSVAQLPKELVYIGFSNGGACAELLATARSGARGVVLIGAPLPIRDLGWTVWPRGVPVQIHFGEADSRRNERVIAELGSRVRKADAVFNEHIYPTAMHHFADPQWSGYDAASAELMFERVLAFLATCESGEFFG
jgi:dienelactone hydrolase